MAYLIYQDNMMTKGTVLLDRVCFLGPGIEFIFQELYYYWETSWLPPQTWYRVVVHTSFLLELSCLVLDSDRLGRTPAFEAL